MPPLAMHTAIAKEVADTLKHRRLDAERGSLYLGATAPDVRIMTRWDRRLTHFFDLGDFAEQSGVGGFLSAHPQLSRPSRLGEAAAGFVAGYLTHLVMDETWINQVYRPCFGERSPLAGDLRANIMDRALQYEMDRARREDRPLIEHILSSISQVDLGLDIGFLEEDVLTRWREVVLDVMNDPPDWERFRIIAGRHLKTAEAENPQEISEFLRDLPGLVEETVRYLTPERIQDFLEESARRAGETVKEYLCA